MTHIRSLARILAPLFLACAAIPAQAQQAKPAQPDIAAKIRGGKVAAAGAIVGAVMKATGGQANAQRVRELVLARCAP